MTERRVNNVVNGQWVYDNRAANKGLGLLDYEYSGVQADGSSLRKTYEYTLASTGRKAPSKVTHRIYDNASSHKDYVVKTDYDRTYGRVTNLTYPTGLKLAYDYNYNGYATREKNADTNYVYRQIFEMDVRNNVTKSRLTNGLLSEEVDYAPQTGQMWSIDVTKAGENRHHLRYFYDGFGNMHHRETTHGVDRAAESFLYDKLHRVTKSTRQFMPAVVIGSNPDEVIDYGFDAVGNLTKKTDYATSYVYNPSRPNAVSRVTLAAGGTASFSYDNNGNMTTGHSKTLEYNVFNKPTLITTANSQSAFSYGGSAMRYKKVETGANIKTTFYIDKVMEVVVEGSTTKSKAYIGNTAIVTQTKVGSAAATEELNFLLKGRLGSTITVTDKSGDIKETNGYDAFGKPRTGAWKDKAQATLDSNVTTRGYTGHEHLDESQLIHMNGRAYDYNLGRFLSVDPLIQEPGNSQSMNPYSYIMNNPLAGTDPTGYKSEKEVERTFKVFKTGSRIPQRVTATDNGNGSVSLSGGNSEAQAGVERALAGVGLAVSKNNGASNSNSSSSAGANATGGNNSVTGIGSPASSNNGSPVASNSGVGLSSAESARTHFRSSEILRNTIPGQILSDNGIESFLNGEYLEGFGYIAGALAEQVLTVLTLGAGQIANNSTKTALAAGRVGTTRTAQVLPQGISSSSFSGMSQTIRQQVGHLSDDIAVHGSRASGTAQAGSDVDIAIRVSSNRFQELIASSFGSPNAGSAKMRTMMHAIGTGKIQAGEAGMRGLRRSLSKQLGIPVDISIIRIGGKFDNGPFIPIK